MVLRIGDANRVDGSTPTLAAQAAQATTVGAQAVVPSSDSAWLDTRPAGVFLLAVSAYVARTIASGLGTARQLIADFEAVHGELQIDNGYWGHLGAPQDAARVLCDQIDEAAGWLYPFGVLVWLPVLGLVVAGTVLTFRSPRSRIPALVATVLAVVVVVGVALSFAPVYGEVIAILE